ncbi:MAG: indole-3-glycerol phosphate synthase TrpC [Bacillota bacterium]
MRERPRKTRMLLDEVVRHKAAEVERSKRALPFAALKEKLRDIGSPRGFAGRLSSSEGVAVIAEIKRASPSRGLIREDFDPRELSRAYEEGGASAISVLTDERYFQGRREHISLAKEAASLPVLRKDFIIDDYQVYESKAIGADAVLLIVSILDDATLRRLLELATSLDMDGLVEVHTLEELGRAVEAGARIVGINNRDLRTFRVSLSTTIELASYVPEEVLLVSESGISCREDILMLEAAGVKAVLVGEALMRARDVGSKLRELLGGEKESAGETGGQRVDKDMRDYHA